MNKFDKIVMVGGLIVIMLFYALRFFGLMTTDGLLLTMAIYIIYQNTVLLNNAPNGGRR